MPDKPGYDFDAARVRTFMLRTFDYFSTAADPELGFPADGNRLVQRWAWYSLNDRLFEGHPSRSHLFEPDDKQITVLGRAFADYTSSRSCSPYLDLVAAALTVEHSAPWAVDGRPVDATLKATIRNAGNTDAQYISVRFWATEPPGTILGEQTIHVLPARSYTVVTADWIGVPAGVRTVGVTVDPLDAIAETDETNNQQAQQLLAATQGIFLPIAAQSDPTYEAP
jgi:hypothetical protein